MTNQELEIKEQLMKEWTKSSNTVDNKESFTHFLIKTDNQEAIKLYCTDIDYLRKKTVFGETIYHFAIKYKNIEMFKFLVKHATALSNEYTKINYTNDDDNELNLIPEEYLLDAIKDVSKVEEVYALTNDDFNILNIAISDNWDIDSVTLLLDTCSELDLNMDKVIFNSEGCNTTKQVLDYERDDILKVLIDYSRDYTKNVLENLNIEAQKTKKLFNDKSTIVMTKTMSLKILLDYIDRKNNRKLSMKNTTWLHKRWQGIQRTKEKDDDIPEHWDITFDENGYKELVNNGDGIAETQSGTYAVDEKYISLFHGQMTIKYMYSFKNDKLTLQKITMKTNWDILNLKNLLNKHEELSNKIVLRSSKYI